MNFKIVPIFLLALFQQSASAQEMTKEQKQNALKNLGEVCDSGTTSAQTKQACKVAGALAFQFGEKSLAGRYYMKSCFLGYTDACVTVMSELANANTDINTSMAGFATATAERSCFLGSAEACQAASWTLFGTNSISAAKLVIEQGCVLGNASLCKEKAMLETPDGIAKVQRARMKGMADQLFPQK